MENKEQLIEQFMEKFNALTDKQKQAIGWCILNIETVKDMSRGEKIPEDEIKTLLEKARANEDYMMMLSVTYKQWFDKNGGHE